MWDFFCTFAADFMCARVWCACARAKRYYNKKKNKKKRSACDVRNANEMVT